MAANQRDEGDVLMEIKARTSESHWAWSWSYNSNLFGYRLKDLDRFNGFIMSTNTESDIVYIPIHSWLPWQREVDK